MSDIRFAHADMEGDSIMVLAGAYGAIVGTRSSSSEDEVQVAVRYEFLPGLIEALEGVLSEAKP